jgi:hypothetical protein
VAQDEDSKTRETEADRDGEGPGAGGKVRNGLFFRPKIPGHEDA